MVTTNDSHDIPKFHPSPFLPFNTSAVELRDSQRDFVTDILIKDAHENNRERRKSQVIKQDIGIVEEVGSIKIVVYLIPEKGEGPDHVLFLLDVLNSSD